jgi:glycosyltransferase involved in cell wall biosynthesis
MPCVTGNSLPCIQNRCVNKNLSKSAVFALEFAFRKFHKQLENIEYFLSPSQALLNLALKSGMEKEKFVLLNNCIDENYFNNTPEYSNNNYFMFVGRLAKDKGVHYLIEAMNKLSRDIEVHIIGTGPHEELFKQMVKDYNLHNIKFLGYKAGDELEEEYKGCITTILPCYWFENFPTTIIESFTYGKPVIASYIGGIPEMVEHNQQGLTFKPASVDALAECIQKLYNSPQTVLEMGKNARQKAENLYNPEIHYKQLISIYEKVLNNRSK